MIRPVMSTIVATNGVDEVAGSAPSLRSTNGSIEPIVTPQRTTMTSDTPTATLICAQLSGAFRYGVTIN